MDEKKQSNFEGFVELARKEHVLESAQTEMLSSLSRASAMQAIAQAPHENAELFSYFAGTARRICVCSACFVLLLQGFEFLSAFNSSEQLAAVLLGDLTWFSFFV